MPPTAETLSTNSSLAAVFHGPDQPLEMRSFSLPGRLNPGEALVRITCCTLCGSDLSTLAGHRREPTPCILGHEIVGEVVALSAASHVGKPSERPIVDLRGRVVAVGDRVVWSVAATCDTCRPCRRGIPQKCESLLKYGHQRITDSWQLSGGLAEYCHLVGGTKVIVIAKDIPDVVVAPASCATSTVAAACRTAGNLSGARVLIFGAGLLGLTASAMAKSLGAESICVCDPSKERLRWALRFGADQILTWDEFAHSRMTTTSSQPRFDTVLEMSGNAAAVNAAVAAADIGGAIVLVGSVRPTPAIEVLPEQWIRRVLSLHGVHNYRPEDLLRAVEFLEVSADRWPWAEIVSVSTPLAKIQSVLSSTQSAIRIAVTP